MALRQSPKLGQPFISTSAHAAVAQALTGELRGLKEALHTEPNAVAGAASELGVGPILYHALGIRDTADEWPQFASEKWRAEILHESAIEAVHLWELNRIYQACADAGIQPLLFKGAALRHIAYPSPNTRPAADTDLLVEEAAFPALQSILTALGFEQGDLFRGFQVGDAPVFHKQRSTNLLLLLDIHVSLDKKPALSPRLSFGQLAAASTLVPEIAPNARAVSRLHSLFLAALHYFGHLPEERKFIWLLDAYLLLQQSSDTELVELRRLAEKAKTQSVVQAMMATVAEVFDEPRALTIIPADKDLRAEAASYYVNHPSRTGSSDMVQTFREIPGIAAKLRYLVALGTPPPTYIRTRIESEGAFGLWRGYISLWLRGILRLARGALNQLKARSR